VGRDLGGGDTGYIDLMARLLQVNRAKADTTTKSSPIIVP
jgi:hypothetical protein